MAKTRKVIHVEFRESINGKKHYYFGSKTAIFQMFSKQEIGIEHSSLRSHGDIRDNPYINKYCVIRQGELIVSQSNREED